MKIWIYESWGSCSETDDFSYTLAEWDGKRVVRYYRPAKTFFLSLLGRYKVVSARKSGVHAEDVDRAKPESLYKYLTRLILTIACCVGMVGFFNYELFS